MATKTMMIEDVRLYINLLLLDVDDDACLFNDTHLFDHFSVHFRSVICLHPVNVSQYHSVQTFIRYS